MSLKCPICGKEYLHDRRVCYRCEEIAINSGLNSVEKKWRCDNFLESSRLVFGNNLKSKREVRPTMVRCSECGKEFSYGRHICHTCGTKSIPFGRIFEKEGRVVKWNCDTEMACIGLLSPELDPVELTIEEVPHFEKLEKTERSLGPNTSIGVNSIQIDEKKLNNFLIYE
jgi:uncharacterized OB-fold protein